MEREANNGRIIWDVETMETFLQLLTKNSIETLLFFEDIKVKLTDSSIRRINPIILRLQ